MTFIVNADDFGKNESVNDAIAKCFAKGLIQRTTIMVNMPAADEAAAIAREQGFADQVGIHLNLTEGRPLTSDICSNPLLCDEKGNFHAGFQQTTKYRLYMDELTIAQIRKELDAQLEKYRTYGFALWHVDSHHHVHTNYPVLRALKPLAKKYGFSSVRLSRNLFRGGNPLMRLYKILYNRSIRKLCRTTTDYFGSYKDFAAYFSLDLPPAGTHIRSAEAGVRPAEKEREAAPKIVADHNAIKNFFSKYRLEIMVHPMYDANGVLVDTDIPMEKERILLNG